MTYGTPAFAAARTSWLCGFESAPEVAMTERVMMRNCWSLRAETKVDSSL